MIKKLKMMFCILLGLFLIVNVSSCALGGPAEDKIQHNVMRDISNFKTYRRIQVINLRSDKVLMEFEGYLTSKLDSEGDVNIMIMTGQDQYQLHYVRLAPEVTYISEQITNTTTDPYHWKINIYATVPDITWHA